MNKNCNNGFEKTTSESIASFKNLRYINTGVGLEVEVERAYNTDEVINNSGGGWYIKEDPSLRNDGAEFITKMGCRLQDIPKLVNNLYDSISSIRKENKDVYDFNERTSIHVHIDIRSFGLEELKSLLILYTLYEDSFFKFAGENRKYNVFCVPLRYIAICDLTDNVNSFLILVKKWKKYCAFNLTRLPDLGTVEFRHMEGNDNADRIITWVHIICKLVDYVKTADPRAIIYKVTELKTVSNYYELTDRIFGEYAKYLEIIPNEFDMAVSDSKAFFHLKTE